MSQVFVEIADGDEVTHNWLLESYLCDINWHLDELILIAALVIPWRLGT